MRNTFIASLLAGAVLASPAIAQDNGTLVQPGAETAVPPVGQPMTTNPASDPMDDPMTTPVPDSESDTEVVAEIDTMAQGDLTQDQQAQYDAWPAGTQTYYDGLTSDRQEKFWMLDDGDKVVLSQVPEEQQALAWDMVDRELRGAAPQTMDQPSE